MDKDMHRLPPTITVACKDTQTYAERKAVCGITSQQDYFTQVEISSCHRSHRPLKAYGRVDTGPEDGVEDGRHDAAVGTVDELNLSIFLALEKIPSSLYHSQILTCSCWEFDLGLIFRHGRQLVPTRPNSMMWLAMKLLYDLCCSESWRGPFDTEASTKLACPTQATEVGP